MAERQIVRSVVNIPPSPPYAGVVPFVVELPVADSLSPLRSRLCYQPVEEVCSLSSAVQAAWR